jgi:hypothetical protein
MVASPDAERPFLLAAALQRGVSIERPLRRDGIDPWFLDQMLAIIEERGGCATRRRRR